MNDAMSLELVVIQGEQAGASTTLKPGRKLTVGASLDNDIVLRDSGLADTKISLEVDENRLNLEVDSGEVDLAGEKLVAGDAKEILPYTVLRVGNSVIACGDPGSAQWQEVLDELEAPDKKEKRVNGLEVAAAQRQPVLQRYGHFPLFLFVGAVLLLLLFSGGQSKTRQMNVVQQAEELAQQIRQLGYADLRVEVGNDGKLTVEGYLDEAKQRAALEALLDKQAVVTTLKLQVGEELAAEVKDIYRVYGISADVEPLGPKTVKVITQEGDVEHLQKVKDIAIRDTGLEDLETYNQPPEIASEAPHDLDPGESVTMVVAGDPAYVVTTSQARYFVGSLLPTGHRIAAITDASVLLEKGGLLSTLNF